MKKAMLILHAVAGAWWILGAICFASGWELITKDDISAEYYNSDRIEIAGSKRIIYTKTEWINSTILFAKGEYIVSKVEIDCSNKTIKLLERQYFDGDGVPGKTETIQNLLVLKKSDFLVQNITEGTSFWLTLACKRNPSLDKLSQPKRK